MPSLCFFADIHLEAGAQLGWPDPEVGNTRLKDAERILAQIAAEECDVLAFGGDAGKSARLGPTSYRILQEAFSASKAKKVLLRGNHDYLPEAQCALHVIAASVPNTVMLDEPKLVIANGIQVGGLPWTPSNRLFDGRQSPQEAHRLATERLLALAQGLGQHLDPDKPSVLLGHWLVSSSTLATGSSVVTASEPILPVEDLAGSGSWDAVLLGHNHHAQEVAPGVWVSGAPMRSGFGEEHSGVGYLRLTWGISGCSVQVEMVHTNDRTLATVDVDVQNWLEHGVLEEVYEDKIVRVRFRCTEEEARVMRDGGSRALVKAMYDAGAHKVVGPQVTVERTVRKRSAVTTDLTPEQALEKWMDGSEVGETERGRIRDEAKRIQDATASS